MVQSLGADYNSLVHKGDVVARLDPSTYQAQLAEAQANLGQAKADELRVKAVLEDAQTKLTRAEALAAGQLIPESDLDAARIAVNQAVPDVKAAESVVVQATAMVDQASLDLEHTIIRSPVDGVVVERDVDVGQTVAASIQSPVLFRIATDLTKMQVQVQVDESDVAAVSTGNTGNLRGRLVPGRSVPRRCLAVRLQPVLEQPGGTSTPARPPPRPRVQYSDEHGRREHDDECRTGHSRGSVVSYTAIVDVAEQERTTASWHDGGGHLRRRHARARRPDSEQRAGVPSVDQRARGDRRGQTDPRASQEAGRKRVRSGDYQAGRFVPIDVRAGLADDRWTELVDGTLHPGDQLVTNASVDNADDAPGWRAHAPDRQAAPTADGRSSPDCSPIWSAVVIVASLLVVFELDRRTASAPFQHLYYMPIIFAGVMFRMRGSLLARSRRSSSTTWRTLPAEFPVRGSGSGPDLPVHRRRPDDRQS